MAATESEVFAIGVGDDVTQSTVDAIATDPDEGHSFHTDDFDGLLELIEVIFSERDLILWDMPPGTTIMPGDEVTLTFTSETSVNPGTYCNEVKVLPGGNKTRSGQTAIVQIGPDTGLCPGEAVVVSKVVNSVNLAATDTSTVPYTYTFEVGYTIKVDNIGSDDLTIQEFIDLLPVGYSYLSMSTDPSVDISNAPFQLHQVIQINRQRVTWKFNPNILVASGTSKTLKFIATTAVIRGNYWNDLLVDFGGSSFPEDRYTWPTALVSVKDVYDVTATEDGGDASLIDLQVWTGDLAGSLVIWNLP